VKNLEQKWEKEKTSEPTKKKNDHDK
jgi:hypothetical protein